MMNKVIEDYVLLEKIGQGQYGNVYKAEHKKNHQMFAVKVMNVDKFKHTPKLTEFTNNQIAILSKINNINIIKFVEMLRTANNFYLVYEYCNGGTLASHIKAKGKLTEAEATKIFLELRNAFEALYQENILHRDLKPTNILFHNGVIKLADFGFCKELLKENDMTQTMVGSPIYMAPEVLKGLIYDIRADIWSLGVIYYEMLYGLCPYEESTIPKLVTLIDNSLLRFPSSVKVSQGVKNLIKRMLTIKYRERISPQQFIKYPISGAESQGNVSQKGLSFNEVGKFVRRSMLCLSQTIEGLVEKIDDLTILKAAFMVFKILRSVQRDTSAEGAYWEILGVKRDAGKWDKSIEGEFDVCQRIGELMKEALAQADNSLRTKMQLQTSYIDAKYYIQVVNGVSERELKTRLLICLLVSRHFMQVLEKSTPDFTDYSNSKHNYQQMQELCLKYARFF